MIEFDVKAEKDVSSWDRVSSLRRNLSKRKQKNYVWHWERTIGTQQWSRGEDPRMMWCLFNVDWSSFLCCFFSNSMCQKRRNLTRKKKKANTMSIFYSLLLHLEGSHCAAQVSVPFLFMLAQCVVDFASQAFEFSFHSENFHLISPLLCADRWWMTF